ncbi:MAG: 1-deoxy-D-xylulose-5-phosphate reductoisomerase [Candidatus Moranbacteria bacterium]|nr:1-deoxy-D-xylulose-5-phosphate reductoisomerase [Candidatus Moranbacteria bacterium]
MKKLAILGSTGNIGTQTLEVVDKYPNKLKVIALSANSDIETLEKQIKKYKPLAVGVANPQKAKLLEKKVSIPVFSGKKANLEIVRMKKYDTLINSVVSLAGIEATLEGIKLKKNVALANKETLVAAGEIVMKEAQKNGVMIMPIDSEHSALFQCLNGEKSEEIHRMIITCSGGALIDKKLEELKNISLEDALGHKTWSMGQKITIDSATLMNKGFEVIEAMWLYDLPIEKIKVVVHPQSIIHSMIEYSDGSIMAQMSEPSMKLPIQYALSYPERWSSPLKRFDFSKDLTFQEPDLERFPCLKYAFKAAHEMGTLPAAMNSANDFMVEQFLNKKCKYLDIARVIKKVMDNHQNKKNPNLADIQEAIKKAQQEAKKFLFEGK